VSERQIHFPARERFARWLKLLSHGDLSHHHHVPQQGTYHIDMQTMPASEWKSSKQLREQAASTTALITQGEAKPSYLPQKYSPHQPGDLFRAYISRPEHYHPRYPQEAIHPASLRKTPLLPERASLLRVSEEDTRPGTGDDDETTKMPALCQLRVSSRIYES
jgi:hypothetical protein